MRDYSKAKKLIDAPPSDQTAAEFYAEANRAFDRMIGALARLLEWKPETVADLIFGALEDFFWRGYTPEEIAAVMLEKVSREIYARADRRAIILNYLQQ